MIWLLCLALAGDLTVGPEPTEGAPTPVHADGDRIRVTYRPNTVVPDTEEIPLVGGEATWTPRWPGIATVEALKGDESVATREVSVRFAHAPASGIAVFLFAASLLFGGIAFGMWKLFAGGQPLPPPMGDT